MADGGLPRGLTVAGPWDIMGKGSWGVGGTKLGAGGCLQDHYPVPLGVGESVVAPARTQEGTALKWK